MTTATVLIPVHQHAEPLRYAVGSVLGQSLQDYEIFLVGDGVTDAVRSVVDQLLSTDDRLRFFDFPKGPRKGEVHWHKALEEANGRFVAYLGSDDCWMPNHLEVLDELLTDADFGHTLHLGIYGDQIVPFAADLQHDGYRHRILAEPGGVDFIFGGHTVAAYRRLPKNWSNMPPDFPFADLYLWRQFIAEPWCRIRSALIPTGMSTATHAHPDISDAERAEKSAYWYRQFAEPAFRERLWRDITQRLVSQSVDFELQLWSARGERSELLEQTNARIRHAEHEHAERLKQTNARIQHLEHELAELLKQTSARNQHLEHELAEMKRSTSWRVTWPLRQIRLLAMGRLGNDQ